MRKVQFTAVIWTLALAVPFTVLALALAGYTTENLGSINAAITTWSRETAAGGRGWLVEFAARWPEVAGMVIGQLVLLTILLFARQNGKADHQ